MSKDGHRLELWHFVSGYLKGVKACVTCKHIEEGFKFGQTSRSSCEILVLGETLDVGAMSTEHETSGEV